MKLIEFSEQTVTIAKDQPEYIPMPAYRFNNHEGRIVCCWELTWKERCILLFRNKIWQQILTFNQNIQPQKLTINKPKMP